MVRCFHIRAALFALALTGSASAFAEASRRVISANLCADELVLHLADRSQIASVSALSADPALSTVASQAAGLPKNRGSVEEIVRLQGDLILTGAFLSPFTRAMLTERGVDYMALPPWSSLEDGFGQIRAVAARLGHAERGEELIRRIEAVRDRLKNLAPAPRSFLVLHRRFYSPGRATLTSQMAELAGLRDASADLGLAGGGFARLEQVLTLRPDYLIVSQDGGAEDQGSSLLLHPALAALYSADKRLVIPDALTLCAGPSTPALLERLAAEIRAKAR